MEKIYIPVTTSPGMFSTEVAVEINLANGKKVSLFADKSLVKNENLSVYLVSENKEEKTQRVLLHQETFETGSRWVDIPV